MSEIYQCQICYKIYHSKSSISQHERKLHKDNRIVPHRFLLGIASQEDFEKYRSAFIFRLKKILSFNIKQAGQKTIFIETFPERLSGIPPFNINYIKWWYPTWLRLYYHQ